MSDKKMVMAYAVATDIDFAKMMKLLEVGMPEGSRISFMEVVPDTEASRMTEIDGVWFLVTPIPGEDANGEWSIEFDSIEERDLYAAAQKVLAAREAE